MIGKAISITFLAALFVGAVLAAGSTVHASYASAQLELREQAALSQQRILREQLAQAQSLQPVVRYAQEHGLNRTGRLAALRLTAPLAQR